MADWPRLTLDEKPAFLESNRLFAASYSKRSFANEENVTTARCRRWLVPGELRHRQRYQGQWPCRYGAAADRCLYRVKRPGWPPDRMAQRRAIPCHYHRRQPG